MTVTEPREEELPEAETGVDPIVLLALSLMLLCGCWLILSISSTTDHSLGDTIADVVGVVGVLLGAVLFWRAAKRLYR